MAFLTKIYFETNLWCVLSNRLFLCDVFSSNCRSQKVP